MMDKRIQIWNILHDGEITAIDGEDGDTLTMFVSIPYLRRRLKPLGDSFVLKLEGVKNIQFLDLNETPTPLREEIEIGMPEILQTASESMPVEIETTMGKLILDFQSIRFSFDTGEFTSYETIEKVCDEYWTEWKANADKGKAEQ